jgi:hypothetical protein
VGICFLDYLLPYPSVIPRGFFTRPLRVKIKKTYTYFFYFFQDYVNVMPCRIFFFFYLSLIPANIKKQQPGVLICRIRETRYFFSLVLTLIPKVCDGWPHFTPSKLFCFVSIMPFLNCSCSLMLVFLSSPKFSF